MNNRIRDIQSISTTISNNTNRIKSIDNRIHNVLTKVSVVLIV